MKAIETYGISKSFKRTKALSDINLSVEEGEIFGLIGPDGAGKTSLFRILTTLSLPDEGKATVCGLDIVQDYRSIRSRIGYMPGHFALYQDLSVEENLNFYATVFGATVSEGYDTIKDIYCQLEPFRKRRAGALSGGMKQKLALCCALVHKPQALFLDEPTTGVDAVSRKEFWAMLYRIRETGVSVFVSTPYMDEASLCDRIALISEGRIIGGGSPSQICGSYPLKLYSVSGENLFPVLKLLRQLDGVQSCNSFGSSCHVAVENWGPSAKDLFRLLSENGYKDLQINEISAGVEDCFMRLS